MIDFSYSWFVLTCEKENLDYSNLVVQLELERAKDYAWEMKWWESQIKGLRNKPTIEGHWLYDPAVKENAKKAYEKNIEKMNEKRIQHMLTALEMVEATRGLDEGLNEFLKREYTKTGLKLPKI